MQKNMEKSRFTSFNSRSASVGQTLIAKKIVDCEEKGMEFEQIVTEVEEFIERQNIYFVLESLESASQKWTVEWREGVGRIGAEY